MSEPQVIATDSSLGQPGSDPELSIQPLKHASRVLAGSMFVMGACGLIYEYTLGALGNNLIGSSHEQIFVIIGLMMFAMGLGAVLQGRIQGRLIDKWLFIEILLGLFGGLSTVLIYTAFVYLESYRIIMYGGAIGIGMMIGMEIPLLIRINQTYSASLRANLSDVLMMDYVGSLAGALLFAYVLITNFSLIDIAVYLGLINVAIGALGLAYFWTLVKWRRLLAGAALVSITILSALAYHSESLLATLQQRSFRDPIIASQTTKYQHLVLTKRNERLSLYINGHLQFNSIDEEIYHELLAHVPLLAAPSRKRVLILGGGDGLALREVLKYHDVEEVVLVDIDAKLTEWASQQEDFVRLNHGAFRDSRVQSGVGSGTSPGEEIDIAGGRIAPHNFGGDESQLLARVKVLNIDADQFLQKVEGIFDVAIIDFPDPRSIEVAKLYSVEFYRYLLAHLTAEAVVAVQSTSPFHAKKVFLCIGVTLREAGYDATPYHQNVPSFGEWGWHLATRSKSHSAAAKERLCQLEKLPVTTRFLTTEILPSIFVFGRGWLKADDIQPNSKMLPRILGYHRQAWKDG